MEGSDGVLCSLPWSLESGPALTKAWTEGLQTLLSSKALDADSSWTSEFRIAVTCPGGTAMLRLYSPVKASVSSGRLTQEHPIIVEKEAKKRFIVGLSPQ